MMTEKVFVSDENPNYDFTINSNTSPLFYQQWRITSDKFSALTFEIVRKFDGFADHCHYGGFLIKQEGTDYDDAFMVGPHCIRVGVEPLVNDINSWYYSEGSGYLTVYANCAPYFYVDIDVNIKQTHCEGM